MGQTKPAATAQDTNTSTKNQKTKDQAPAPAAVSENQAKAPVAVKNEVAGNSTPVQNKSRVLATIKSKRFTIEVDEFGRIAQVTMLEKKYRDDNDHVLKLFNPSAVKPLEIRFADSAVNEEAFKVPYKASASNLEIQEKAQSITLTQELTGLTVTKEITFYPDGHYDLHVKTSKPIDYYLTTGSRPIADTSKYMIAKGALIKGKDGVLTTIEDGNAKADESFSNVIFASAFDRYYTSVV